MGRVWVQSSSNDIVSVTVCGRAASSSLRIAQCHRLVLNKYYVIVMVILIGWLTLMAVSAWLIWRSNCVELTEASDLLNGCLGVQDFLV